MNYRYDETEDRCGKVCLLVVVFWIGGIVVGAVAGYFVFLGYSMIYWTQEPMGWVIHILGYVLFGVGAFPLFCIAPLVLRKRWKNR